MAGAQSIKKVRTEKNENREKERGLGHGELFVPCLGIWTSPCREWGSHWKFLKQWKHVVELGIRKTGRKKTQ